MVPQEQLDQESVGLNQGVILRYLLLVLEQYMR